MFQTATEISTIAHLASLGGQGKARIVGEKSLLQRMFLHFDKAIRKVIRAVLDNSIDPACILWKVAEECCNQATISSGTLDLGDYSIALEEAYLESPYDPDFEAEEYHEHEECMADPRHAEACEEMPRRRLEERRKKRQS